MKLVRAWWICRRCKKKEVEVSFHHKKWWLIRDEMMRCRGPTEVGREFG